MPITKLIKNEIKKVGEINKDVYIEPYIPPRKLKNVIKSFNLKNEWKDIIAIYDNTFFGAANEGIVFTDKKLVFKSMFEEPKTFYYEDLSYVKYEQRITFNKKGKKEIEHYLNFYFKNGKNTRFKVSFIGKFNYNEFELLVNKIINETSKGNKIESTIIDKRAELNKLIKEVEELRKEKNFIESEKIFIEKKKLELSEKEDFLLAKEKSLKNLEKQLNNLQKELNKKDEQLYQKELELKAKEKFLEEKELKRDELIQEKFSQKLKEYEERIKLLKRENKELKEQLGYYG